MLYAKPCCAVDPIENEEDRKKVGRHSRNLHYKGGLKCVFPNQLAQQSNIFGQSLLTFNSPCISFDAAAVNCTLPMQAVTNINTLLDKADRVYHQLMGHRPQLESLLSKVNEAAPEKPQVS